MKTDLFWTSIIERDDDYIYRKLFKRDPIIGDYLESLASTLMNEDNYHIEDDKPYVKLRADFALHTGQQLIKIARKLEEIKRML